MMNRARITHSVRVLVATLVGVLLAAPLFYMALNSLMPDSQTADLTPQLIPNSVHFSNYTAALSGTTQVIYSRSFLNSVIFTFFVVLLQWMLCISGGLAISKMRFRSRTFITVLLGVSLFIPILTTLIPTFIDTLKLGLINTYPGVILPIVAQTGFGTLLFRQYISQMPEELSRRGAYRRRELVDDAAPAGGTARQAGDRCIRCDLGADSVEHVPLAVGRGILAPSGASHADVGDAR